MKQLVRIFSVVALFVAGTQLSYSQCTPDESCTDINEPGELCPNRLADGTLNQAYSEVITVLPPQDITVQGNVVPIAYIVIDSITKTPDGMDFATSSDKFWADSISCIAITGTPMTAGDFQLSIYVTPFFEYTPGTYIPGPQVVDDSSVVMTISAATLLSEINNEQFQVFEPYPNPFNELTSLTFRTQQAGMFELEVYNLTGTLVYSQAQFVTSGVHQFQISGNELQQGTYVFVVSGAGQRAEGTLLRQ